MKANILGLWEWEHLKNVCTFRRHREDKLIWLLTKRKIAKV